MGMDGLWAHYVLPMLQHCIGRLSLLDFCVKLFLAFKMLNVVKEDQLDQPESTVRMLCINSDEEIAD